MKMQSALKLAALWGMNSLLVSGSLLMSAPWVASEPTSEASSEPQHHLQNTNTEQTGLLAAAASVSPQEVGQLLPPTPFVMNAISSASLGSQTLKSGVSAQVNEIELTLGKAQVLNLPRSASRVSISDPEVAGAVVISPTQIQLIGKKVGVANLLIWSSANAKSQLVYDINVHRDVSVLAKQLEKLDPGINLMPLAAEDSVILAGQAESAQSAQFAVELAKAFFAKSGTSASNASTLNSQAPGSTTLSSPPNIINLIKIKGEPSTKVELVQKLLQDIDPNVKLKVVPGPDGSEKAILTGTVRRAGMVSKAVNTAAIFYGKPGIKVLTGPAGNSVRTTGSGNFQVADSFNDNMDINVLQGSVVTDSTGNVVSMMQVTERPQIVCSIKFLDISRSDLNQLGNSFMTGANGVGFGSFSGAQAPASGKTVATFGGSSGYLMRGSGLSGAGGPDLSAASGFGEAFGSGVTQILKINNDLSAAISALAEKRKVRSLAEPNITFLSGEKASFLAGGEIPVPVLGGNGQISLTYHEFGVRLNLVGTVTDDGKIHMQVAPEVSSVDPSNSVTTPTVTVPGFKTRRLQTTLELNDGQSFVLAGLFSEDETESVSKFPGIGSLPIIGSFFRSKWNTKQDSELVVIIRPVVRYAPAGDTSARISLKN